MSDETTLLPCPFCGGKAKESSPESNGTKFWRITCQHCYAGIGGTHRGMNQAAWNTRAMHGTLTAEQVSEIVEKHTEAENVGWNGVVVMNYLPDWQAIADELNARAERTCENVAKEWGEFECSECEFCADFGSDLHRVRLCPDCGRQVKR